MGEQFVGKKFEAICPVCDEKGNLNSLYQFVQNQVQAPLKLL